MQQTHNTRSGNIRARSVGLLNRHLAATIELRGQVKQAHWSVHGLASIALHQIFEKVADTRSTGPLLAGTSGQPMCSPGSCAASTASFGAWTRIFRGNDRL